MPFNHKACLPLIRPLEPSFMPKSNYRFDVPVDHMSDRYKPIGVELATRFAEVGPYQKDAPQTIAVKPVKLPNIAHLKQIPRNGQFSLFNQRHIQVATDLIKIFDECKTMDDLLSVALYVRDQVNPILFVYAYSVALMHRTDSNVELPSMVEMLPRKFLKNGTIKSVQEDGFILPEQIRKPIEVPFERTSSKLNPEFAMSYFREDLGINSHHWHWHLVFPINGPSPRYYDKDRRGELFYYMHHQLLNRYNAGRMTEGIPMVEPFSDFRQILEDGYYPKMTTTMAERNIPPRQNNMYWYNLKRTEEEMVLNITDLERWRDRIIDAIDRGFAFDTSGKKVNLNNMAGIDVLANFVESSALSINPQYYGSLHNHGHNITAFCHDPEAKYNAGAAVMGSTTTAARDPFFYRWHSFIDEIFTRHKDTLTPYPNDQLKYDNVTITKVEFILNETNATNTELKTFWQKTDVNIAHGLDFSGPGPFYIRFTHLNYEPFSYRISVNNTDAVSRKGTVRIFLIPIKNQAGQSCKFDCSRKLAIEVDRFTVNMKPGANTILRKSSESALTIPFEKTFPKVTVNQEEELLSDPDDGSQRARQCGCGWPQHHLLPKGGDDEGFPYRVFVMISNYAQDEVKQATIKDTCNDGVIFCGLRDQKYPDARAMGYPFDRPAAGNLDQFEDFLEGRPNMITTNITIRHIDEILKYVSHDNLNVMQAPSPATDIEAESKQ